MTGTEDIFAHFKAELQKAGAAQGTIDEVMVKSDVRNIPGKIRSNFAATEKEARCARFACDAVGDMTFAARVGLSRANYSSLTSYIAKYSKTLEDAITQTSKLHAVDSPALKWTLHRSGNHAALKLAWEDGSFAKYHRFVEFMMFSSLARIRAVTQTPFRPLEIRFDHEVGSSAEVYSKLAGCPVVFGTSDFEMLISVPSLTAPIPTYDEALMQHLTRYCQRILSDRRPVKPTLTSTVEGLLLSELPTHMMRAEEAAAKVGMSARTFARRLTDEGTTFREIADDVRCDLAKTLIKDKMSLSKVAFFLGYADQAAFSTAFKRWTGISPNAFG